MQQEAEAEAVTWMSYVELGHARGTSAASAKRYANRQRWRKQPGNDGTVRVAVPPGGAVPRETVRGTVPRDGPDLSRLLTEANRRADEANKRADAALALADRLERDLAAALTVADQARASARDAQDAADVLRQADAARRARGRWARLRAAWKGA